MSVLLKRLLDKETIGLEAFSARDGQGKTTYLTSVDFEGNVRRKDDVARMSDGTEVKSTFTIHVDGDQTNLPSRDARLTLASGEKIKVLDFREVRRHNGLVDHVRVLCREE